MKPLYEVSHLSTYGNPKFVMSFLTVDVYVDDYEYYMIQMGSVPAHRISTLTLDTIREIGAYNPMFETIYLRLIQMQMLDREGVGVNEETFTIYGKGKSDDEAVDYLLDLANVGSQKHLTLLLTCADIRSNAFIDQIMTAGRERNKSIPFKLIEKLLPARDAA